MGITNKNKYKYLVGNSTSLLALRSDVNLPTQKGYVILYSMEDFSRLVEESAQEGIPTLQMTSKYLLYPKITHEDRKRVFLYVSEVLCANSIILGKALEDKVDMYRSFIYTSDGFDIGDLSDYLDEQFVVAEDLNPELCIKLIRKYNQVLGKSGKTVIVSRELDSLLARMGNINSISYSAKCILTSILLILSKYQNGGYDTIQ